MEIEVIAIENNRNYKEMKFNLEIKLKLLIARKMKNTRAEKKNKRLLFRMLCFRVVDVCPDRESSFIYCGLLYL